MRTHILAASLLSALPLAVHAAPPAKPINLTPIGTYASGIFGAGGAEIAAHDPATQRLFVVNAADVSVDVLDISNPAAPTKIGNLDLGEGVANSVAVKNGIVAVAVEAKVKTDAGSVVLLDANLNPLASVTVGSLPDMLTFSPNGRWILVANEGEPNSYGKPDSVDPVGSVSIIDISAGVSNVRQGNVRTLDFSAFNNVPLPAGIRVFGPGASVAQDLEPEYITVSHDSKTAWVTLQENNALATVDIKAGEITSLISLGFKDHSLPGNGLDVSDRDGAGGAASIRIGNWPLKGVFMPDGIASYNYRGDTFLVLANEGDARTWDGYNDEMDINSAAYILDPVKFPNALALKQSANLGRLRASRASGDIDRDGDWDEICTFGARSFSIRAADGTLIFDSGDQFERAIAAIIPVAFNVSNDNNNFDSRSRSKGPEPEGVVVGKAFGRTFAFIGVERVGGVMVYDVSNPYAPLFVNYANNRNFANPFNIAAAGDLGPEGLVFISAEESPNGQPLLVTANELSGTTTIYQISR